MYWRHNDWQAAGGRIMKHTAMFFCLMFLSALSFGQEETLLQQEIESGGFGAPVVRFTDVNDDFGVMVGGRGGWIVNHAFSLGGGGYGLANSIDAGPAVPDSLELSMGYGGLELEFIGRSDRLVHLTFYTLIGAGGVSINPEGDDDNGDDDGESDAFFVVEPIANVELNITTFFRINAGAGYRFVWNVDTPGLENKDLSGATVSLTFKFGKF
jgi:hypothetical protein